MTGARRFIGYAALAVALVGGCSRTPEQRTITKKGIIKSIDLKGRKAYIVTDNKLGDKLEIPGQFTDDTVVTINGKTAHLSDIHTGDNVEVTAYHKGKGSEMEFYATKVVVSRPATSQPAG